MPHFYELPKNKINHVKEPKFTNEFWTWSTMASEEWTATEPRIINEAAVGREQTTSWLDIVIIPPSPETSITPVASLAFCLL